MIPIDRLVNNTLVIWEDIFKPKEFKVLEKPKFRFWGKWRIETPEGDVFEYDRKTKLQYIIRDLEFEGYIKREKFYVFGVNGIYFASSKGSGSWIKLPNKPTWDMVSPKFFYSRINFVRASIPFLKDCFPDTYVAILYKDLLRKIHKIPFEVYHL